MPPLLMLIAALVTNYARYRRHESTICSTTRRHLPRPLAALGLVGFFAWFFPHLLGGYPRCAIHAVEAVVEAVGDSVSRN